ncbi:MAG: GLPGLI family protein, partial [Cyclobacteriaceae bacterium]
GQKERRWKITTEQKEILGFTCRKAVLDDSTEVVAWYTSEIPTSSGPETFNGLPGIILELEMENKTITAIDAEEASDITIEIPEKGKKVTATQFEKIVEKKMKEMQNEFQRTEGSNMIIIRGDQ